MVLAVIYWFYNLFLFICLVINTVNIQIRTIKSNEIKLNDKMYTFNEYKAIV